MKRIDDTQHAIHIAGEAAGLFVAGPYLLYAVQQHPEMRPDIRKMLIVCGIGTMLIDGWLLGRNLTLKTGPRS